MDGEGGGGGEWTGRRQKVSIEPQKESPIVNKATLKAA